MAVGYPIEPVDPGSPEVGVLVARHLAFAHETTPPEAVFALGVDGLLDPAVSLFGARSDQRLVAIGALKRLDATHGELKSMHTLAEVRGQGVGQAMVAHLLEVARQQGLTRVSLETGPGVAFGPAHRLYLRAGFTPCGPFADYPDEPTSAFFTRTV